MVTGLENVAVDAPVICTSTATEVDFTMVKPPETGSGTPLVPDVVAVALDGTLNVNVVAVVSGITVPDEFFAVITVLGGRETEVFATAAGADAGTATVVAAADDVVTVPEVFTVVPLIASLVTLATGGGDDPPPPPQPPAKRVNPSKPTATHMFHNLFITSSPFFCLLV